MEGLIYAYHAPKSAGQRAWTEQRLAELAAERAQQRKSSITSCSVGSVERSGSGSAASEPTSSAVRLRHSRPSLDGGGASGNNSKFIRSTSSKMDTLLARKTIPPPPTTTTTILGSSESSLLQLSNNTPKTKLLMTMSEEQEHRMRSTNPFEFRHGRRYLRNVPYPLPCDLAEIQRQNMRTLLSITVFGGPICSPRWQKETPKKVLELCCGGAYWTSMAHDYFVERGVKDVEFVGLDIAPLAPDLRKQGIEWKFVQHDIRCSPMPFDDGEFDLVMCKEMGLVMSFGPGAQALLEDCVRMVKPGGTLEIWEPDHILRSLLPDTPPPVLANPSYQAIADETATFPLAAGHEFCPLQNKHLTKAGKWTVEALERRGLHPAPCAPLIEMLLQEPGLMGFDQRRVAIPFGKLRWEKKAESRHKQGHHTPMSANSWQDKILTVEQLALRHTALLTMLQLIESMEPMLREASGKNSEEWGKWWASMMAELLDPSGAGLKGECLELGATWATKR